MTLDEAIKHCEEVAESHDRIAQIKAVTLEECKCAKEHRQLATWLRELKQLREQTKTEGGKVGCWEWVQYESKPNFGNWHCSECRCILRGEIKENPIRLPKYCPECGAKMEAKE